MILRLMESQAPTRLVVDIEADPVHFKGTLIDGAGDKHDFDGWLEFARAVTSAARFDQPEECA